MAPAPRIGTEFAGYRIEGLLGRGGMGVVYRAEHPRLGSSVALKVMAPEVAVDEGFRERFVSEARMAAAIKHPNIVPIYDAGEWRGDLYIAMGLVEGMDLADLLDNRQLTFAESCGICLQVAGALDAAHRKGLVHRDVKPHNVLLDTGSDPDSEPVAYLADLGLTKQISSQGGVTSSGELIGTIDYMAPEQISGLPVDGRADVYSLACVLFECLTGTPPYPRDTKAAVLWAHLNDELPRPTSLNPDLPHSVDEALARGMAKQPQDRFATAKELVAAVAEGPVVRNAQAAGEEGKVLTGSPVRRVASRPAVSRVSWKMVLLAVAAVGVMGGGVILVVVLARDNPSQANPPATPIRQVTQAATPAGDLTAFDKALLRFVPDEIRQGCRHSTPTDKFDAILTCATGGAADSVTYSHARSGQYLYEFMAKRRTKAGLPEALNRVGSCRAGQTPSINDTVAVGWHGQAESVTRVERPNLLGRILCAQTNGRARIEWLTHEPGIFAIAHAKDLQTLYAWWETEAGPEP